jgi:hypothetical protein
MQLDPFRFRVEQAAGNAAFLEANNVMQQMPVPVLVCRTAATACAMCTWLRSCADEFQAVANADGAGHGGPCRRRSCPRRRRGASRCQRV